MRLIAARPTQNRKTARTQSEERMNRIILPTKAAAEIRAASTGQASRGPPARSGSS